MGKGSKLVKVAARNMLARPSQNTAPSLIESCCDAHLEKSMPMDVMDVLVPSVTLRAGAARAA